MKTDSYYNTVVLASLTYSGTMEGTDKRMEGHTIQYDKCGNVISVDDRAIAYFPVTYFFADGMDIDGKSNSYTEDHLKLVKKSQILKRKQ